ncbi:MAG: copper chaperone PCu(A)C [Chloroflexota bacterium]
MNQMIPVRISRRFAVGMTVIAVGLAATACSGATTPTATPTGTPPTNHTPAATASPTATPTPAGPSVTMSDVWARATPGLPDENSAVYAVLQNKGAKAERVVSASVPAAIAKRVELHTTVQEAGVMKMVQVEGYDLPASGTVKLEPGGNHIMLLGIAKQFKVGDTFTVTLKLQSGSTIESKVEVKNAPGGAMGGSGAMGATGGSGAMGATGGSGAMR